MKKSILLIVAIFSVASAAEAEITKKMKEFKIIPDIVPNNVPELLKITFDSRASVNMGNEITPSEARNQPTTVAWNADKNAYYTIVLFDADAPSPADPFLSQLVTWIVGNIPGNDIDSGDVLAEYFAVAPPRGKKLHRAIFLLYKQPRKLNFDEKPIDKYTVDGRANYPLKKFSEKYSLGDPVAGNFYLSKFDRHVMEVYEMLNCCFEYNEPEK